MSLFSRLFPKNQEGGEATSTPDAPSSDPAAATGAARAKEQAPSRGQAAGKSEARADSSAKTEPAQQAPATGAASGQKTDSKGEAKAPARGAARAAPAVPPPAPAAHVAARGTGSAGGRAASGSASTGSTTSTSSAGAASHGKGAAGSTAEKSARERPAAPARNGAPAAASSGERAERAAAGAARTSGSAHGRSQRESPAAAPAAPIAAAREDASPLAAPVAAPAFAVPPPPAPIAASAPVAPAAATPAAIDPPAPAGPAAAPTTITPRGPVPPSAFEGVAAERIYEAVDAAFGAIVKSTDAAAAGARPSRSPPTAATLPLASAVASAAAAVSASSPPVAPSGGPAVGLRSAAEPAALSLPDIDRWPSEAPPAQAGAAPGFAEFLAAPADVHELFAEIAATHMKQVRDIMIGLKWGEPIGPWLPICDPVIASLRGAAEGMHLPELREALDAFRAALGRAGAAFGDEGADKQVFAAYDRLVELMPQAFSLEDERRERESIIVHALLLQVPGIHKLAIDRVYAAGLSTLAAFASAPPDELASAAGIDGDLAERIVRRFQQYRKTPTAPPPGGDAGAAELAELGRRIARFRKAHAEFEELEDAWTDESVRDRRRLRRERETALLDVRVLLARLGEVETISKIDRLSFAGKIDALEGYLRERERKR